MRGKGFIVVHTANDELFKFGKDKPRLPVIPDSELTKEEIEQAEEDEEEEEDDGVEGGDGSRDQSQQISENGEVKQAIENEIGEKNLTNGDRGDALLGDAKQLPMDEKQLTRNDDENSHAACDSNDDRHQRNNDDGDLNQEETHQTDDRESLSGLIADILLGNNDDDDYNERDDLKTTTNAENTSAAVTTAAADGGNSLSSVSMDERLRFYFKVALKFHLRQSTDMPATPQEVYKAMQNACPEEEGLDFRKSSFKKSLKFFQEMQTQGEFSRFTYDRTPLGKKVVETFSLAISSKANIFLSPTNSFRR